MVAGSMGIQVTSSTRNRRTSLPTTAAKPTRKWWGGRRRIIPEVDDDDTGEADELDSVQPLAGWLMYEVEKPKA